MTRVSVVIPTLDAGESFVETLDAVRGQRGCGEVELVVIDSESRDATVARARKAGARVRRILRSTFNHGVTRNMGAALTQGDFIAFLTQDALPADSHWLAALCDAAEAEQAAGAYSRVIPRPDCSPLVRRSVEGDLVFSTERQVKRARPEQIAALQPFERRVFFHFNNVSSLVRRSVFARIPFPEIPFGEDLAWGGRILEAGHAVVFEPASVVVHSHPSALREDYLRHHADARLMRTLFGFRNRDGWRDSWPAFCQELRRDRAYLRAAGLPLQSRLFWLAQALALRGVQVAGQLAGSYAPIGFGARFAVSLPRVECSKRTY